MGTPTESYHPVDWSPDEAWRRRFRLIARVCLTAATIVALAAVAGDLLEVRWLTAGPRAWGVRSIPAASLAACLITIAGLWLTMFGGGRYVGRGRLLLALVLGAGVAWLGLTVFGVGIDPEGLQVPASSAAGGLAGLALAGILVSLRRGAAAGQVAALIVGIVVTVPLLGYIIGARALTGFPFGFGAISIPTIAVLLLASAAVVTTRPDAGVIDVAIVRSPGGVVLRRLLIPVLALPPVLIVAISAGESRPLRTLAWVGSALSAVAVIALVATARAMDSADRERARAADERMALAAGLTQDAALVAHVLENLGVVEGVPDRLTVTVRRAAAEGVVGGDAYAAVGIGPDRLGVVLLDIESKGAEPAALAVRVRDSLTSSLQAGVRPSEALDAVGWLIRASETTATAFVGVVAPDAGEIEYANAGHVPALLLSSGGVRLLEHTGPLLHPDVGVGWSDETHPIENGDALLIYSDGIADVVVRPGRGASVEEFVELVERCPHREPERIVSWCLESLEAHPGWTLVDDATLMAVGVERR